MDSTSVRFSSAFDGHVDFGAEQRCSAFFGRDVLRGLVSGIEAFQRTAEQRHRSRSLGPALLGAFMWLDDEELLERIVAFPHACVVVTKQQRSKFQQPKVDRLKGFVERGAGFPARGLPELAHLLFRENGKAPVVGPGSDVAAPQLPMVRTIGYRRDGKHMVPILHTKMVLLGDLWWHDEDSLGHVTEVIGFRPQRLWVGSANGTASSRSSLEFGMWLEDPPLLKEAKRFLTQVLQHSEDLDPDTDHSTPTLVEPDFDDDAFAEYLSDYDDSEGAPW